MLADRDETAVDFVARVLAVVVPNKKPLLRLLAEQIATGCHGDGLDHVVAALAHAAGTSSQRHGATLIVLAVKPRAWRQGCNVNRHEGAQDQDPASCFGRTVGAGSLAAGFGVCVPA